MAKIGKKEYNLNDPKECTEYWTDYVSKELVGKKIIKVEYMSSREAEESMWYSRPLCFQLDDGTWVYPMRDDEGNDGGALCYLNDGVDDVLPVLSLED